MVEMQAREIKSEEDVEAWMNRSALDLGNLIQKEEARASQVWQKLSYDPMRKMCRKAEFKSDWDYSPMMKNGFAHGAFLPADEAGKEPFVD